MQMLLLVVSDGCWLLMLSVVAVVHHANVAVG